MPLLYTTTNEELSRARCKKKLIEGQSSCSWITFFFFLGNQKTVKVSRHDRQRRIASQRPRSRSASMQKKWRRSDEVESSPLIRKTRRKLLRLESSSESQSWSDDDGVTIRFILDPWSNASECLEKWKCCAINYRKFCWSWITTTQNCHEARFRAWKVFFYFPAIFHFQSQQTRKIFSVFLVNFAQKVSSCRWRKIAKVKVCFPLLV